MYQPLCPLSGASSLVLIFSFLTVYQVAILPPPTCFHSKKKNLPSSIYRTASSSTLDSLSSHLESHICINSLATANVPHSPIGPPELCLYNFPAKVYAWLLNMKSVEMLNTVATSSFLSSSANFTLGNLHCSWSPGILPIGPSPQTPGLTPLVPLLTGRILLSVFVLHLSPDQFKAIYLAASK